MNTQPAIEFQRFLYWLGPDLETAGQKYESIRSRLIMMFRARRCAPAEDLADATFERVAHKLASLSNFTGDPARYFCGVAKKIYLEHQHEVIMAARCRMNVQATNADKHDSESVLNQLDLALNRIPHADRELILTYYTGSGKSKINHRRALAEQFGMRPNALRLRVFRIRRAIKNYMLRSNIDGAA